MISLERLKTKTGQKWLDKNAHRLVMIWSDEWSLFWKPNRRGYTQNESEAGIYTIHDAFDASGHCGKEKGIMYKFAEGKITQEPSGKAKLLLNIVHD